MKADCAVLVISAIDREFKDGVYQTGQTREHAMLADTFGIKHIIVAINKMDGTEPRFSEDRFNEIRGGAGAHLTKLGFEPEHVVFVPISGGLGDNLTTVSDKVRFWHQ